MLLVSLQMRGSVARNYIFSLIWRCYGPNRDILDYWGTILYCLLSYYILSKDKGYRVETIDMGISHWDNGVSGTILLEQWCQWNYGTYCTRYDTLVRFLLWYVCTWSHALNNIWFLVSNFCKEHGSIITYFKKYHSYRESHRLLFTTLTKTYEPKHQHHRLQYSGWTAH